MDKIFASCTGSVAGLVSFVRRKESEEVVLGAVS